MRLDEISELQQQRLPLIRFGLAPGPFERAARRRNRTVDVLRIAFGDGREQFASRRIMCLEALTRGGIDPFALDQHLLVGTVGIRMARERNGLGHSHDVSPSIYAEIAVGAGVATRSSTIMF